MTCLHIRMINPYHTKCQLRCNMFRSFLAVPSTHQIRILECGVALVIHDLLDLLFHLVLSSTPMTLNGIFWAASSESFCDPPKQFLPVLLPQHWVKPKMKKFTGQGAVFFLGRLDVRDPHIVMKSPHIRLSRPRKVAASWRYSVATTTSISLSKPTAKL